MCSKLLSGFIGLVAAVILGSWVWGCDHGSLEDTSAPSQPRSQPSTPSSPQPIAQPEPQPTPQPNPQPNPQPTPQPNPQPDPGGIWRPAPGTSWQWQLTGTIDTSLNVKMFDIDLYDASQSIIDKIHAKGAKVICYFSAGSREDWRPDAGQFPSAAIGDELDGWPGENWIDIRNAGVRDIMKKRLDLAKTKKCDGVEPDNIDGYSNQNGLGLTASDQLSYNRFLATEAHARGLSIGLKNDLDQVKALVADFDWALNEECFQYDECDLLKPFIQAGKAVFTAEYGGQSLVNQICPKANALNFDTIIKNLDLDAFRIACR